MSDTVKCFHTCGIEKMSGSASYVSTDMIAVVYSRQTNRPEFDKKSPKVGNPHLKRSLCLQFASVL